MEQNSDYLHSVNLNRDTDFPYLVLHIENEMSYPMNPGFHVVHWHEDLQFIYVLDGMICVKTLEEEEIISAGEGVFINKNVVHVVEQLGPCRYKSFLFPEHLVSFYAESPAVKLTRGITENEGISLIVLYETRDWCAEALALLRELIALERNKTALYCFEVLARLSALWLIMLRNIAALEERQDNLTSVRTRMFLQYIEAHYAEEVTLTRLAQSASVSKSECLRCFKSTLQTTPYRYLMDFRLSKAASLLRETDLPISHITTMTGFNQPSYFGKLFREKMGCSPREYRTLEKPGRQSSDGS